MEINDNTVQSFDENQSIKVIKEMIQVSQKNFKNDGILFILWGWLMFYSYVSSSLINKIALTFLLERLHKYFGYAISIFVIVFSIYYIFKKIRKVKTYVGVSLRYVWISLFVCLSLTNMIIFNVNHQIDFELQHPIFMIFIAFATVITGGIIRYRLVIFGGIIFGGLAYACSYFNLQTQMLFEAAAWLIAFIIPGHILYANRKK